MSEQSGTEKGRERLWMCCMGVYCLTLFLVLLGFLLMEYCAEETALELSAYQDLQSSPDIYLVGINSAGAANLQILPRIGPVLAQAIIDYRTQNGPFRSVEQLLEVPGIGEKTLEQLRPLISLD